MRTVYIDVDGKWGILLNYDFTEDDFDDIAAALRSFGMRLYKIEEALNVLSAYDTGMAISRDDLRMTSIYISKASSYAQFWNTVNHELMHAEQAILDYYDVDWDGEPPAYLAGYLLLRVVEEIARPCF